MFCLNLVSWQAKFLKSPRLILRNNYAAFVFKILQDFGLNLQNLAWFLYLKFGVFVDEISPYRFIQI